MRVLIIDDDAAHRDTIAKILEHACQVKLQTMQAASMAEATNIINKGGIDAILLDMTLPDARGQEGFQQLFKQWPHIPIVIVSGVNNEDLAYGFIVCGAQDYLVKGEFNGDSLIKAVLYACARHAFRLVSSELSMVSRSLAAINGQMEVMQEQYRDLLRSIGDLNHNMAPINREGAA